MVPRWSETFGSWLISVAPADNGEDVPFAPTLAVTESKVAKNRLHLDVRVGRSADRARQWGRVRAKADELVAAGGRILRVDDGQGVVMADPEGNEFCVAA
jgi:hypothetical protein